MSTAPDHAAEAAGCAALHAIGELITAEWIEANFDAEHIALLTSTNTMHTTTIGIRDGQLQPIDQHTEFTVGRDAVMCIVDGRPSLWGGIDEDDPDGDGDSISVDRIVIPASAFDLVDADTGDIIGTATDAQIA